MWLVLFYFSASIDYSSDDNIFVRSKFRVNTENYNYSVIEKIKSEKVFKCEKDSNGKKIATLRCKVKKDDIQVNWIKDDNVLFPIKDQNKYQINKYNVIEDGKERMLVVTDVKTDDEGEYICQSGKYTNTLYLTINESAFTERINTESPSKYNDNFELYFHDDKSISGSSTSSNKNKFPFIKVKDVYVSEDAQSAELRCKVKNLNSQVEWLKDNKIIRNDDKFEISLKEYERILKIKKPTIADNGNYICKSGKHRVVLNLLVSQVFEERTISKTNSSEKYMFNDLISSRNLSYNFMKINDTLNDSQNTNKNSENELTFYLGQKASLICQIKFENESMIWSKENKNIVNDDKYTVSEDGLTLIIEDLNFNDSGIYLCHSEKNPNNKINFNLKIREPKREIVQNISDVLVSNQNQNVVFECISKGPRTANPFVVKWYKNGMEISIENKRYSISNDFEDNLLDGSVKNFNKLIISPPITEFECGDYTIFVDADLKSSAKLDFKNLLFDDIKSQGKYNLS
jgi:hypothetical protein